MSATLPVEGARPPHWPGLHLWLVDLMSGAEVLDMVAARYGFAAPLRQSTGPGAPHVRDTRLSARIALRALLAGYVGCEPARAPFALTRSGKPSLERISRASGPHLEFSLAHAETTALIAVSGDGAVGVDIEAPRSIRLSDHRRAMLLEAATRLAPIDPLPDGPGEARFLQAWVRLEALAKATGEGLGTLLGRLEDKGKPIERTRISGDPVVVRDIPIAGPAALYAAVAGTGLALSATNLPTPATWLPLDLAWFEEWVERHAERKS